MTDSSLPQRHRPVIRVFVSSTFSDLKFERNALQANVWPVLERYCQQRGFQFQAIDLRWGVPTEAGLDHRTMRICFEELRRSQETSPRPNFLILLGDRYGWRPLPEEISTDEFQKLENAVTAESASLKVLKAWYPLDANAIPAVHILRSRRDSPDGHDYTDLQKWNEVQEVLWSIINRAFPPDQLVTRFDLTPVPGASLGEVPSIVRFQASATEQEIWHGALQASDSSRHVFAFVRKLQNLKEAVLQARSDQVRKLKDFVDLTPEGQFDLVAQNAHEALRTTLRERLGNNYCEITTTARLVPPSEQNELDVSTDHVDALCKEVRTKLEQVIDREIDDYQQGARPVIAQQADSASSRPSTRVSVTRELELEIQEHVRFGRERAPQGGFVGRSPEIRKLQDYLAGDDRQPLVVYGPSGTGKTALLAHVALPVVTLPGESIPSGTPVTLLRFLGTTPATSAVRPLLTSLCRQLRDYFPLVAELPSDFNELTNEFHSQLARATPGRPIQLFLDALDQLDDADAGRYLGWLRLSPSQPLPEHVKLVVSCLSDADDDPAGTPYRRLSHPQLLDKGIALEELSPEEAVALLFERWLKSSLEQEEPLTDPFGRPRRTLTTDQRDVIQQHICRPDASECRRPLYLKILFEEARLWRSFDQVPPLGDSVHALLQSLFRRLRRPDQHGRIVQPALGYIISARYGLTENELLEILFADPGYKAHLDQFNATTGHEFPLGAKRIPIALWARFRYDLAPYLAERAAPGGTVLNFYHRQVGQFVRQWLLEDRPSASYFRQRRLARYWLRQPWWLESREQQRARMRPPYSARPAQLRKATELPESLFAMARTAREAGLTSEAESAYRHIEKLFQRLEFLEAKNEGGLVFELPLDFRQAIENLPPARPQRRILELLAEALQRDIHFIDRHHQDYPQGLFQCLWNLCWWYDSPQAVEHYHLINNRKTPQTSRNKNEPKLCKLLETWLRIKANLSPELQWLRSLRPAPTWTVAPKIILAGHDGSVWDIAW